MKTAKEQADDYDKIMGRYTPTKEERDKARLETLEKLEREREARRKELWEGIK